LIADLRAAFTIASGAELTVEVNPGDITPDYLEALHASRGADSAKAAQQQLDLTLATTD
jgi:coproporphyrinogen III oxidase-like Fe-S oxidoreductase